MAPQTLLRKSFSLLIKQQTNIISAALIIMITVVMSIALGLIRNKLLTYMFDADTIGMYFYSARIPDTLFQLVITGALSSAFIPIFSDFISHGKEKEGHKFASNLLCLWLAAFGIFSILLVIFADFFAYLIAPGLSPEQLALIASLMRIIIIGQMLFIIGSFLSVVLQSYSHFFVPGVALASYNLGIIIGILTLSSLVGIYAPVYGTIMGAFFYIIIQLPYMRSVKFSFTPSFSFKGKAIKELFHLMWPRTISLAIYQGGLLITGVLISFISGKAGLYAVFDWAMMISFTAVNLFGNSISQAAFPILSRQRNNLTEFKTTFLTSFNQILYLTLPFSVLFIVLRIPVVRLVLGGDKLDWTTTVLTGQTLAWLAVSLFAQALLQLILRAFYALHDTKTPLFAGGATTILMCVMSAISVFLLNQGVQSIAISYSISNILFLIILLYILHKRIGGFLNSAGIYSMTKIFTAAFFTAFALYIPIKLLDRLVFDTTRTVNLLILTGISSILGCLLYLFLTWLFAVHEAKTYLLLCKKIGNWREILKKSEEPLETARING